MGKFFCLASIVLMELIRLIVTYGAAAPGTFIVNQLCGFFFTANCKISRFFGAWPVLKEWSSYKISFLLTDRPDDSAVHLRNLGVPDCSDVPCRGQLPAVFKEGS